MFNFTKPMHKSLAKKMDILDWILLDMAMRINPKKLAMRAPVGKSEHLVGLHLGNPSWGPSDEVDEEEEEEEKKI